MGWFFQRRGINRLLKIVYKEGSLQGFYKNGVQGGYQHHFLGPCGNVSQEEAVVLLSWSYALIKYVRYLLSLTLTCLVGISLICFSSHMLLSRRDVDKYKSFSMPPRDITQQIFSELVFSCCLTKASLKAFRDCALQVIALFANWIFFIKLKLLNLFLFDMLVVR